MCPKHVSDNTKSCLDILITTSQDARESLSERETIAFEAGLAAAHAEEALMKGDNARARAHFNNLRKMIVTLGTPEELSATPLKAETLKTASKKNSSLTA